MEFLGSKVRTGVMMWSRLDTWSSSFGSNELLHRVYSDEIMAAVDIARSRQSISPYETFLLATTVSGQCQDAFQQKMLADALETLRCGGTSCLKDLHVFMAMGNGDHKSRSVHGRTRIIVPLKANGTLTSRVIQLAILHEALRSRSTVPAWASDIVGKHFPEA